MNKLFRMAYKHNGDFRAELRDASGDVKVVLKKLGKDTLLPEIIIL